VAGLPAIVLLDPEGRVQTSRFGTGAELRGALPGEIERLLAGKSLERPELSARRRLDVDESQPTALTEDPGELRKIEQLGAIVIRAKAARRGTDQIYVQLSDKGPGDELLAKLAPHLRRLSEITGLHLQDTRITDAGLEPLKGMSNIRSMNLTGTAISDRGLDTLQTVSGMKLLIVSGTRVTEAGILALKRALPGLHVVHEPAPVPGKSTK